MAVLNEHRYSCAMRLGSFKIYMLIKSQFWGDPEFSFRLETGVGGRRGVGRCEGEDALKQRAGDESGQKSQNHDRGTLQDDGVKAKRFLLQPHSAWRKLHCHL